MSSHDEVRPLRRRAPRTGAERLGNGGTNPLKVSARILADLRSQIVSLRRLPGAPVSEKEIAAEYRVSRTPVREALLRLADEGLVEIFPQSGTFVARIPVSALPEAVLIRKTLEEASARLAAEHAQRSHVIGLWSMVERQRECGGAEDREGFHLADEAMHGAIAEAAGCPGFWTLAQQVKLQVDRYRRLTLPQAGRMARVVEEHAAVIAAIEAHDPDRAAALMGAHLDGLLQGFGDIRHLNPDFFVESAGHEPTARREAQPQRSPVPGT